MLHTNNIQMFRDELSNPNLSPDAGLKLELRDFAPERLADGVSDSFLINSVTLCQFLDEAEHIDREDEQRQKIEEPSSGIRKRRRETTPPEIINSEDERIFEDHEQRVLARASEDDSSFKLSQTEDSFSGSSHYEV